MKNILFLTTTPTMGGNGDALISAAMETANEQGANVHLIHIREKQIGFCQACYGCAKTGVCVQKDDFMDILHLAQCQPCHDYYGAYRVLEDMYDEGKLRAIGVSNFYPDRLVDLASFTRIPPMVNQIETHVLNQRVEDHEWMGKYHVAHEAWTPFGEGRGCL